MRWSRCGEEGRFAFSQNKATARVLVKPFKTGSLADIDIHAILVRHSMLHARDVTGTRHNPFMDPRVVLLFATWVIFLNGGMLGLMHKSLSPDVRPSAMDWGVGTLLTACGSVLLASQVFFPPSFIVPVANGILFLGGAFY
jgi:hypothetical protein